MVLPWRKRRGGKKAQAQDEMELVIPNHFQCPISLDLMKDPVTLSTGITYDRSSIETWIEAGNQTCPITNKKLTTLEPIPNHAIRKMIQDWCVDNKSYGVDRIPTPRIPITSVQVSEILSKITVACRREDAVSCRDLVAKINALGKESERNRRCIVANATPCVLSAAFGTFANASNCNENMAVLEEILSALTWMYPLDEESKSYLGSPASLECIVWFFKCGDLSARRNAVLGLKHLLSSEDDQQRLVVYSLAEKEGAMEALVKLIKEPICPTSTKASLMVIFYMASSSETTVAKFVELGLVSLLLEMLVDSEKSICEKALGVLDQICDYEQGREMAYHHALTMPVLVKKILRVSHLATEFSVSIIWKLCKKEKREEGAGVIFEALQVGSFQKLLLLIQVGCDENTKEKATELLKLLNLHRERLECIDSVDFKDLKRPF